MAKQKTIPELEAEKAENERKITQLQHKKQQLENRITYYEKGERRKRAHHLITRGAAIESVALLTNASCRRTAGRAGDTVAYSPFLCCPGIRPVRAEYPLGGYTHATPAPNRAHSGSQGQTRGVFAA